MGWRGTDLRIWTLVVIASVLWMGEVGYRTASAAPEPARGPEDVPKLGTEDYGTGGRVPQNHPPTLKITCSPRNPIEGRAVTVDPKGGPSIAVVYAEGRDQDGDDLTSKRVKAFTKG
jgi:hypothetical protein